jgi:hypothetical protein
VGGFSGHRDRWLAAAAGQRGREPPRVSRWEQGETEGETKRERERVSEDKRDRE